MAKKKRTSWIVWLRRLTQTGFFVLFCYLFLQTVYHPINKAGRGVAFFFNLDPLVALNSWLASHAFVGAMLLSLVTLAVTLICGRWFCGWVCPFGALHNFFTSLRGGRAKQKLEAGGYNRWQKAKYYALVAFLVAALAGANVVGWLDPFSFFFRSLSTSIYPAMNKALVGLFTWIYDANPGVGPVRLTAVTEPHLQFLAQVFPRRRAALLLGQHADWSLVHYHRRAQLLPRALLVPLCLSFRRAAGGSRKEPPHPPQEGRGEVQQLPAVPG